MWSLHAVFTLGMTTLLKTRNIKTGNTFKKTENRTLIPNIVPNPRKKKKNIPQTKFQALDAILDELKPSIENGIKFDAKILSS